MYAIMTYYVFEETSAICNGGDFFTSLFSLESKVS